jgi:hypothetical protein
MANGIIGCAHRATYSKRMICDDRGCGRENGVVVIALWLWHDDQYTIVAMEVQDVQCQQSAVKSNDEAHLMSIPEVM